VKFTQEGSVRVVARLRTEGSEPQLEMEVADTGVGMSQQELSRIFGAFLQDDQSTTRRFGGTGLGLSITRRLVELMGGDIEVASESGQGSVFAFRLPTGPLEGMEIEPCSGLDAEHHSTACRHTD
jgi:signal transduction histidine kinase